MLSVSFLMAVNSAPSCFLMWSSNHCIDASTLSSMLANPLPLSFLDTYCMSTSSLWCSALCMVISFLVLWSICLSSSPVHFRKGCLADMSWSVYISKSQRRLCVSFSRTDSGLCIYYLFVWSNFSFLHNSQWITLPTQSCQVLFPFCTSLLHSVIMWLIISSLSPYNQHIRFCCIISILVLI